MHRLNRHKPIKFCSLLLLVVFILTGCSVDNLEIIAYYSYVPPIENILEGSQTKEADESFIAIKEESTKDASIVYEQLSNNGIRLQVYKTGTKIDTNIVTETLTNRLSQQR